MTDAEKNDIFYVASLIEFIARKTKNRPSQIVEVLGLAAIEHQLSVAEVNHCLSFEQVSDELISDYSIPPGTFDAVADCRYTVPSVTAIGKNYQRLILDVQQEGESPAQTLYRVFTSFVSDSMSDFNSAFYYSNPSYFKESFLAGYPLE